MVGTGGYTGALRMSFRCANELEKEATLERREGWLVMSEG